MKAARTVDVILEKWFWFKKILDFLKVKENYK